MKKVIPNDAVLIPKNAKRVFKGIVFDVYQWPQIMFDGSTKTFEMIKRVDTVKAICIINGKILLQHEQQPNTIYKNELPGGRVEEDASSLLDEIKREVKEETGYDFAHWKLVHVAQVTYKIEGFFHYFLAWESGPRQANSLDPGERIDGELVSFKMFKKLSAVPGNGLSDIFTVLRDANSITDLLKLKVFRGIEVDR